MSLRKIAEICEARFHRRPSHNSVKMVLAYGPTGLLHLSRCAAFRTLTTSLIPRSVATTLCSSMRKGDKRLIQDLKTVRESLLATDLEPKYAHALIGRSIFICYLEDRSIID